MLQILVFCAKIVRVFEINFSWSGVVIAFRRVANNADDKNQIIENLYYQYRDLIYLTADNILNDKYASEDVVHEVFLRLASYDGSLDLTTNPSSLLTSIARNIAIDMLRKGRSSIPVANDSFDNVKSNENPEEIAVDGNFIESIAKGIEKLGSEYSDMFILKYHHGLDNQEVADLLGISKRTVQRRLHVIKRYISRILKKNKDWEGD